MNPLKIGHKKAVLAATPRLRQMIAEELPAKRGTQVAVTGHQASPLLDQKTLEEQGILQGDTDGATVSCTYVPTNLCAAVSYLQGLHEEAAALEGLTQIAGATTTEYVHHLPKSLEVLTLDDQFNENFTGVKLPSALKSLAFGEEFNQSLEGVIWPKDLQSVTFGKNFNQSLEGVKLPAGLEDMIFGFGCGFNQNLKQVTLPGSIRSLSLGGMFSKKMDSARQSSKLGIQLGFQSES
jgi:hypothetical protein